MNVARCVSSIETSSRQTRASSPRATTMSLRATYRSASSESAAAAPDPALDDHALVERELARDDAFQDGLEVGGLRLREEADLAKVDAEDRDVDLGHGASGAQERPVAAEHDQRVGRRQLAQQRVHVAGRGLPVVDVAHAAPAGGARRKLDRGLLRGVVGEPDAGDLHVPVAAVASAMRSPMSAQPGPACEMDEEFAVALRSEDRRGDDRARAETQFRGRRDHALEHLAVDRRVANDPAIRPALARLELRLHERDDRGAARRGSAATGPRTLSREMNDTSMTAMPIGSGSVDAVSVRAFVRSIEVTRSSRRRRSASWPRPTSSA